ncbi:MAG: YkgJ family cysteine cluster protein [Candidatus Hermodarchaeota archaeon]
MPKKNDEPQNSKIDEETETKSSDSEKSEEKSKEEEPKTKFTFKCTRCDKCCLERGPIPITFWDLEFWARNGVIANFMPYLDVYQKPDGVMDIILKPLPPPPEEGEDISKKEPFTITPIEDLLEVKCPLYNQNDKKCLVYDNRPLSCRVYPLEFDGKNFSIVDVDCPGVGEEGMTKEELKDMRESAKTMYYELTRIRIALPVLNQIVSQKVMMDLMRQNLEAMSKMSDEDRAKLDEIFKKTSEKPPE